jgi:hypothetical protein
MKYFLRVRVIEADSLSSTAVFARKPISVLASLFFGDVGRSKGSI